MKTLIIRQGDVILKQITSLPEKLKKQKTNVIAYGEAT